MLEEKKDQGVKTKHSMATKHDKEKVHRITHNCVMDELYLFNIIYLFIIRYEKYKCV